MGAGALTAAGPAGGRRPRLAFAQLDVGSRGEPTGLYADLLERARESLDLVVVSRRLAPELRGQVEWRRVPAPGPRRLAWVLFFLLGGLQLLRARADLVHVSSGMPRVPNRVDLSSVHFCQAAFDEAVGGQPLYGGPVAGRAARRLVLGLERWCYGNGRAGLLVAACAGAAEDLARCYPDAAVTVAPLWLDTERFRPDPAAREALRAERGVAPEELVAVFVGREWRIKGLDVAIEALGLAAPASPAPLRLWALGPWLRRRDRARLQALAARHGVAERVELVGHRHDVERFYQGADLFVLPTRYDNWCWAAHEAAACGLPVIATAVNGIAELVGDGEAGLAVAPTPGAVAEAIVRLAGQPALRRAMGAAGRRRCLRFTAEASVAAHLELYERLLFGGPRRASGGGR